VIGTGLIARATFDWLLFRSWKFQKVSLYDLDTNEAARFSSWLRSEHDVRAEIKERVEDAVSGASLVLFTTTAPEPHIADEELLEHSPTILHLSLRDIGVKLVLASQNIVDDVDHCLKARTSLHLAEMATGNRNFVSGTLVDVMEKRVKMDRDRARIFSPFGLGVLDIALGNLVFEAALSSKAALPIPDFFSNSVRW
jgi:N-[(2S)-2-amino-2-carboxyethyl]-L-glutamate dehydrogenase